MFADAGRVQREHVAFQVHHHAHRPEQGRHGGDIAQVGRIFQLERTACQEGRRHQSQRGVLGSVDRDRPVKLLSASDDEFVQRRVLIDEFDGLLIKFAEIGGECQLTENTWFGKGC